MTSRVRPARGRVERDRRGGAAAAIEQQGVAGLRLERRDLVHDAAGHADELVLRPPGQGGQLRPGHRHLVQAGQRERDGAFEGGRGGQAGARGQVGVDRHVGAAGQVAGLAKRPGHPGRVGGPAGDRSGLERVEVRHDLLLPRLPGGQHDPAVGPAGRRGGDPGADGEGQHEHLGVVRAAHQVDPAGREPDAVRRAAVLPGEPLPGEAAAGRAARVASGHGARQRAAAWRGSTGSKKTPAPSSALARCRVTPGARSAGARCRCRWAAG